MNAVTIPELAKLATEINVEHAAAIEHARSAVQHARKAGEFLLRAKDQIAHGQWLPWIREHCRDISERSLQGYMRLARHCLEHPEQAAEIESGTLREALANIAEPMVPPNPQRVADLPAEEDDNGIPARFRNFDQRQAQLDHEIEYHTRHLAADFEIESDGLATWEKRAAWKAFMEAMADGTLAEAQLRGSPVPMIAGQVTVGRSGEEPVYVLTESRKYPGYWHDVDLRQGSASGRPVRPAGLQWRLACNPDASNVTWTMAPDRGQFLELIEATA